MSLKIETYDQGLTQRTILAAMVMNPVVLSTIASRWSKPPFASKECCLIANWCIEHFQKYNKAPKSGIKAYYAEWQEHQFDKSTSSLIHDLLMFISDEASKRGKVQTDHVIDLAKEHFTSTQLNKLQQTIESSIAAGKLEKAETAIANYTKVELGNSVGVDLFEDEDAIKSTFEKETKDSLIHFRQPVLRRFFHNELEREGFVAFVGPQKSGKTFNLINVAWSALLSRCRVAFFGIGDQSERQVKERFLVRACRHPSRSKAGSWPFTIKVPIGLTKARKQQPSAQPEFEERTYDKPLDAKIALARCKQIKDSDVKSKECYFKLACYPNLSISILGLNSVLEIWERKGWSPDVIVIDYPDNLLPVNKNDPRRDQINMTWQYMRAMAQDRRCLQVVGTQVKATGFNKRWLDRTDFAEDNRKLSHVTGMVGINVTREEKELGVSRLNWIVKREGEYNVHSGPSLAGCLYLADPWMKGVW